MASILCTLLRPFMCRIRHYCKKRKWTRHCVWLNRMTEKWTRPQNVIYLKLKSSYFSVYLTVETQRDMFKVNLSCFMLNRWPHLQCITSLFVCLASRRCVMFLAIRRETLDAVRVSNFLRARAYPPDSELNWIRSVSGVFPGGAVMAIVLSLTFWRLQFGVEKMPKALWSSGSRQKDWSIVRGCPRRGGENVIDFILFGFVSFVCGEQAESSTANKDRFAHFNLWCRG